MATSERIQELLDDAFRRPDRESRRVFLRSVGMDAELRDAIEELLESLEASDDFLERSLVPTERLSRAAADPSTEVPPQTWLGPYRISSRLAEGAMGVVYVAEQEEPLRRRVALKLIRPGLGSPEMLARFQLERQSLARMDHPNIARVLDGGATADGRPYFVMELVDGPPITTYCDQQRLGIDERIALVIQVCEGVRHAHQKGIIHRDLKPTNILVATVDGVGVPKIIDFGVAKSIEPPEGDSGFTSFGRLIGTPEYMSPEQAELGSSGVDTRSDVYSLGILLFELLTGDTPIPGSLRRSLRFEERRRRLLTGDTPRPSLRLEGPPSQFEEGASRRSCSVTAWRRRVAGDLDWIVLKALDFDRVHRYQSPGELADDLRRFLDLEPVAARPPSVRYKLRKFVRRHRWPVAFAAGLLATLLVGVIGTTTGLIRAAAARKVAEEAAGQASAAREQADVKRREAESARREAEQARQAANAAAQRSADDLRTAVKVLTATVSFLCEDANFNAPENLPLRDSLLASSLVLFQRLENSQDAELREQVVTNYYRVAQTLLRHESPAQALQLLATAEQLARQLRNERPDSYLYGNCLALVLSEKAAGLAALDRFDESEATSREVLRIWEPFQSAQPDALYGVSVENCRFANVLYLDGQKTDAMDAATLGLKHFEELLREHPENRFYRSQYAAALRNHAAFLTSLANVAEATPLYERSLTMLESLYQTEPENRRLASDFSYALMFWGQALCGRSDRIRGGEAFSKAVSILDRLVQDNPHDVPNQLQLATLWHYIADNAQVQQRYGEARHGLQQSESVLATVARLAPETPDIPLKRGRVWLALGQMEDKVGRPAAAVLALEQAIETLNLARTESNSVELLRALSAAYRPLAEIHFRAKQYTAALAAQHELLEFVASEWQQPPHRVDLRWHYATMCNWAGRYARLADQLPLAEQHSLHALQLLQEVPPQEERPFVRVERAETHRLLAELELLHGRFASAAASAAFGLAVWANPQQTFPKDDLANFRQPAEASLARLFASGWTIGLADALAAQGYR